MRQSFILGAALAATIAASGPAMAQAVGGLLNEISAQCNVVIYEDDCLSAIRRAVNGTRAAPDPDKARVNAAVTEISTKHPELAPRIKEITDAR